MLNCNDIACRIIALAENIRAKILYDVSSKPINSSEFFRMKFDKDRMDRLTICNTLYKHKNAA